MGNDNWLLVAPAGDSEDNLRTEGEGFQHLDPLHSTHNGSERFILSIDGDHMS